MRLRKVLVIDDDTAVLNVLRIGLHVRGYQVLTAQNGLEALEVLEIERVDLVIVDLMMPVMDGMAFLKSVRNKLKLGVPVVVLTGVDRRGVADELIQSGASVVLHKPVQFEVIETALKDLWSRVRGEGVGSSFR